VGLEGHYYMGLFFPFTGATQFIGTSFEQSVLLAIDEVNEAGGIDGMCVGYVKCDTATQPGAPTPPATFELMEETKQIEPMGVVIGPVFSSEARALEPVIAANGKAVISGSAGVATLVNDDGYFLRTQPDSTLGAKRTADLIYADRVANGTQRILIQHLANEFFAVLGATTLRDRLLELDVNGELTVQMQPYDPATDASYAPKAIDGAIAFAPDLVMSFSQLNDSVGLVQTAIAKGFAPRIWWGKLVKDWMDRIGDASYTDGRFFGLEPTPGPALDAFNTAFEAAFGVAPQGQMSNNYDAACLAMIAMALSTDPDRANGTELRDILLQRTARGEVFTGCVDALAAIAGGASEVNYEGASGNLDFDAQGEVAVTYDILVYDAPDIVKIGCIHQDGGSC
jgi:ABC-type branched-subunit amino acid transport system substrate-binding protein